MARLREQRFFAQAFLRGLSPTGLQQRRDKSPFVIAFGPCLWLSLSGLRCLFDLCLPIVHRIPMSLDLNILIERWFAVGWLVFGLSHLLYPAKWAALFLPLRERETGGLLLGTFNLLLGLFVILGHNVWTWSIPVIVTLAGWIMTLKSIIYLLFPRALARVMPPAERLQIGFRIAGAVAILLGALLAYDSFCRG